MSIPLEQTRKLVGIADCQGNEVGIVGGALNVNAAVVVPGDNPQAATDSQDLSVGALTLTDAFAVIKEVMWFALHLSAPLAANQTLTVTFISADGAAFNTIILNEILTPGFQDKYFAFPCDTLLRAGDHIKVDLTNAGAPAITANLTVMFGT